MRRSPLRRGLLGRRGDLIVAVYRHQVETCAEAGPALLANSSTPHAGVAQWINLFVDATQQFVGIHVGENARNRRWPAGFARLLVSYFFAASLRCQARSVAGTAAIIAGRPPTLRFETPQGAIGNDTGQISLITPPVTSGCGRMSPAKKAARH